EQVPGEQRRLVSPGAGADLDDHVAVVVGVLGDHRTLELGLQLGDAGLGGCDLLVEQRAAVGRGLLALELPRRRQVLACRLQAPVGAHHLAKLAVALGQLDVATLVCQHAGVAELRLDLSIGLLDLVETFEHAAFSRTMVWRAVCRWATQPPAGRRPLSLALCPRPPGGYRFAP